MVKGENVPHFSKMSGDKKRNGTVNGTSDGTLNVFQILGDIQKQQLTVQSQCNSSTILIVPELATPFRTTTPSAPALMMVTAKQADPVHVNTLPMQNTSQSGPPAPCAHVHKLPPQVLKPGELLALRKVQYLHNGRTSVNRLPLMKQDILSHHSSCFEGIEHFPGEPYRFHLKPERKPARHAPRKVPIHLEDAFKEEIKSLVELGILEEVKEPTDWVNSYVIVEKDSGNYHSRSHTIKRKLRICLDPRDLNGALERKPYHAHSVDDITAKLQGMTVFTIVDFKKGYWMVVLHPDSRKLTCMAVSFGRFQWTRLPMGTVAAQDIFQSKLDSIFIGMEGVTGIADDMVIAGRDEMEHDRNFLPFMEKCMSNNLTLNSEKIQFKQSQVSLYGHCWLKQGISPDPKKIKALNHMEFPLDKETMRSFLGMVNYLNRHSVLSVHLTAPLSALKHQAVDYKPSKVHYENFNRLKMEVSNMRTLPYFDVNAETTLQMDASKKGLSACLIQKGKVICYASRALTKTEQNYQNLEREALGTIWGMEKFHYYLYGKEFTLETDQKPLVSIYKKQMIDISPRVQRLIVRSFPYLPFKVVYKKGTDIPVADALSRVTPMDPEDNIKLPIIAVNMITTQILMSTDCQGSFSNKLE